MLLAEPTSTVEIFKKQINTLLKEIHAAITVGSSLDYETLVTQIYIGLSALTPPLLQWR